jgi:opacity protein-like surface antigen
MRSFLTAVVSALVLAPSLFAQVPTSGNIFVGYSYNRAGVATGEATNLNGWNGSLEGKIFPFVGLVADISGHYGSESFSIPGPLCPAPICNGTNTVSQDVKQYNALFGPRVSFAAGRYRPFAHALFGVAHITVEGHGLSNSDTSFATALGGGLDYRLKGPIHWRFQGDYLRTNFFGEGKNDFRFSTGPVLHF